MECTQRLECTQDLYETRTERVCPEQIQDDSEDLQRISQQSISKFARNFAEALARRAHLFINMPTTLEEQHETIGFLGICGVKHPVKKGPNKIGRDPQTCSIVLNLNSISRQHAVINILNKKDFMLMDLDSANKTKLMDKILPPYIPHPLKNGDLVQFGDIFGVFRLLEEDDDLPMTQAIDIPETPVATRHMSKFNKIPNTTVPESPDVSDRDDSFIAPSQPKGEKCFKNSNSHFIKPSSNTISIKPIGSSKIDNVYWSSSKRSVSLNSDLNESLEDLSNKSDNNISISIHDMETQNPFSNTVQVAENQENIHELETQMPFEKSEKKITLNIHEMETQVPYFKNNQNEKNVHEMQTQAIHELETQAITSAQANDSIDSIYTAETQLPYTPSIHSLATQLPEVCKINNQQEMQINLFATSKDNDDDIFSADTQPFVELKKQVGHQIDASSPSKNVGSNKSKLNTSDDDEIILEEIDSENFEDDLNSQPIISSEFIQENDGSDKNKLIPNITDETKCDTFTGKSSEKKSLDIHSDSSTDCEDILVPGQKDNDKEDDDLTDCEDILEDKPKDKTVINSGTNSEPVLAFEDMLTQRIDDGFEDLPTQVITMNEHEEKNDKINEEVAFEDLPTQVIHEENEIKTVNVSGNTKSAEFDSPFKIPFISPIKLKRKEIKLNITKEKPTSDKVAPASSSSSKDVDDENYYAETQDILEDLCSQQVISSNNSRQNKESDDDELVPCSVEDYKTGDRFPHLENNISPTKTFKSPGSTDEEEKVADFVTNLSSQQIRDMVGVDDESYVAKLRKEPSDPSDVEVTPRKVKPIKFMDIDFPDSQEIKTVISQHSKTLVTESSSESETENDSQENTPILFKKKRKPKKDAKIDLTKKFDVEALPTRIITRVRKPTSKLQNDIDSNKITNNILKPKFMTEQEEEIDKDLISENISRLKSKSEKSKLKDKKGNVCKDFKSGEKENETQIVEVTSKNIKQVHKSRDSNKDNAPIVIIENVENKSTHNEITKDDNSREMHNEKETAKRKKKNDKPKVDSLKDNIPSVKVEHTINKASLSENPIEITTKENTRKRGSKQKTDAEILVINSRVSDKKIEDNSPKNTSTNSNTSAKSTRSTRGRRMVDAVKTNSQEENSQKTRKERPTRQKQTKKPVEIEIDLTEEITEVRRSKRQRSSKEKKEEEITKVKSILKKDKSLNHEQSTVYSVSPGSGTDSPVNLKRGAPAELGPPSPKRTRSNTANVTQNNTSLRSTPARMNRTQHVLFTAFPSEEVRAKLERLGAVIVSDVTACTMVLTLQIKRTFKLLCAVGLGKPIVGPSWVQACADSNMIVDPWLYVLKDEAAEKRFQFNLERVLHSKRNFLKGYNVSATPNVLPNATEMKLIVECSGGVWKEGGTQWVCVSCAADKALWPILKQRGAVVVTTEFILGGVLRQKVDITATKL